MNPATNALELASDVVASADPISDLSSRKNSVTHPCAVHGDPMTHTTPPPAETTSATPAVVETPAAPANDTVPGPPVPVLPPVRVLPPVANDNAKKPKHFLRNLYADGRVEQMLVTAGYDWKLIPRSDRVSALWVAWAFKAKLFDRDDIAEACDLAPGRVRRIIQVLRDAAKPGTVVA